MKMKMMMKISIRKTQMMNLIKLLMIQIKTIGLISKPIWIKTSTLLLNKRMSKPNRFRKRSLELEGMLLIEVGLFPLLRS